MISTKGNREKCMDAVFIAETVATFEMKEALYL